MGEENHYSLPIRKKSAIYQQSVENSTPEPLITLSDLNQIIKATDTIQTIPVITWENENEFHFFTDKYWYAVKFPWKDLIASVKLPEGAGNFNIFYPKKTNCMHH